MARSTATCSGGGWSARTDTVLAGKYLLESVIGAGGFGSVYRARHLGLDHRAAVKVLKAGAIPTRSR